LHELGVEVFANVGADGLDGGAFAGSYSSDMGEGVVGGDAHLSPEGVDFAGHVALSGAPNGAVAGQVTDTIEAHGDAGGFQAHAGGRKGRFNTGVTGSHYNDIESLHS